MRMIRPLEVRTWLPVIDQQFFTVMIEEPVLVHAGGHPPPPAQWATLSLDNREDMDDIQEQSAGSTFGRPQRTRIAKRDRMVLADGVGVRGNVQALGGDAADDRSQCLQEQLRGDLRCSCGGQRASS